MKKINGIKIKLVVMVILLMNILSVCQSKEEKAAKLKAKFDSCYERLGQQMEDQTERACMVDPIFTYCSFEDAVIGSGCTSIAEMEIEKSTGKTYSEKKAVFCKKLRNRPHGVYEECRRRTGY